jgi:hypothetical protein
MSSMGRAQAAAAVVRRLNAAVKSRRLYEKGHSLRAQTVNALHGAVTAYHERFGSFVLETHRNGLIIEGRPFEGGESVDALALMLYSVAVWQLVLLPGITEDELSETMDVVTLDRETILNEGGFTALLEKYSLNHVRVFEMHPGEGDVGQISLELLLQMLDGSLSPADRAMILSLLRGGPEQAQRLLSVIFERTRQAFPNAQGSELAKHMYAALSALDRLIVDAPHGESQHLFKELATAVAEVDDPKRTDLHAAILDRAAGDLSARALLTAMTSEQIARMVIPCLETGAVTDPADQIMSGLPFDPQKARDTLSLVSSQTGRKIDIPPALEELRLPEGVRNIRQDLTDFQVTNEAVAVSDGDLQALVSELQLQEIPILRDQSLTLLNLVLIDQDEREVDATLEVLTPGIERLIQHGEYEQVGVILQHLESSAAERTPKARRVQTALHGLITSIPNHVTAKDVAKWTDDQPILMCLKRVSKSAAGALGQALSTERDLSRRQLIATILSKLGEDIVDSLAPYLKDANPEVVRSVVRILAQLPSPKGLAVLRDVTKHPDAHVRKEMVSALASVPSPAAQSVVVSFLQDSDLEIREQAFSHLRPETLRQTQQVLISMVQSPELATRHLFKMRLIRTLADINATEAIPILRRLGAPLKLRKRDREIARIAREAVARLTSRGVAS